MSRIQIFTDSTCDLSEELKQAFQIEVVPLYVVFEGDSYQDGVTIQPKRLFDLLHIRGSCPRHLRHLRRILNRHSRLMLKRVMLSFISDFLRNYRQRCKMRKLPLPNSRMAG